MSSGKLVGSDTRVQLAVCMNEEDISSDILHVWQWIIMSLCNGPNVIIIITDIPGIFFCFFFFPNSTFCGLHWIGLVGLPTVSQCLCNFSCSISGAGGWETDADVA